MHQMTVQDDICVHTLHAASKAQEHSKKNHRNRFKRHGISNRTATAAAGICSNQNNGVWGRQNSSEDRLKHTHIYIVYIIKIKIHSSCEIEDFVDINIYKDTKHLVWWSVCIESMVEPD